jgi:hypothetical protein
MFALLKYAKMSEIAVDDEVSDRIHGPTSEVDVYASQPGRLVQEMVGVVELLLFEPELVERNVVRLDSLARHENFVVNVREKFSYLSVLHYLHLPHSSALTAAGSR